MTAGLDQISSALTSQWSRLRSWMVPLGDDLLGARDAPSSLDGWTTGELVAHLGRAMEALTVCTPAPEGTVPLTLAEYLGSYPSEPTTSRRRPASSHRRSLLRRSTR